MNPGNDGSCERKVSELEQKLDNIVSLLTNPQQQQQPQNVPLDFDQSVPELWRTPASQTIPSMTPSSAGDDGAVIGSGPRSSSQPSTSNVEQLPFPAEPMLPLRSIRPHLNQSFVPPRLLHQPDFPYPDELLSFFQSQLTQYFPFVVIPSSTTAEALRQQKPFLYDAIMLVASKQRVASQREAGDKLLAYLGDHLLLRGEKSLDLLQGLLVYLAWGNHQFHNSAQMSALLQLAIALVAELDLGKTPRKIPDPKKSLVHAMGLVSSPPPKAVNTHTSDEMRAFVGCFYLSSIFSQCYRKLTAVRHTAYLGQCCKLLDEAAEYPTDLYLTSLVRVQMFLSRGLEASRLDEPEGSAASTAAVSMYVKSFQRELRDSRTTLSASASHISLLASDLLLIHFYSVEISLLEIGLYESPDTNGIQRLRHLDQLSDCLLATRAFFDRWFELPNSVYANLPTVVWAQVANTIMAASRLVLLDRPDWDLEHAREVANFAANLEKVASRVEEATATLFAENKGADAERALLRYVQRVRWVKGWYEGRIAAESQAINKEQVAVTIGGEHAIMANDFMNLDDMFWQDFVGEWRGDRKSVV